MCEVVRLQSDGTDDENEFNKQKTETMATLLSAGARVVDIRGHRVVCTNKHKIIKYKICILI